MSGQEDLVASMRHYAVRVALGMMGEGTMQRPGVCEEVEAVTRGTADSRVFASFASWQGSVSGIHFVVACLKWCIDADVHR